MQRSSIKQTSISNYLSKAYARQLLNYLYFKKIRKVNFITQLEEYRIKGEVSMLDVQDVRHESFAGGLNRIGRNCIEKMFVRLASAV